MKTGHVLQSKTKQNTIGKNGWILLERIISSISTCLLLATQRETRASARPPTSGGAGSSLCWWLLRFGQQLSQLTTRRTRRRGSRQWRMESRSSWRQTLSPGGEEFWSFGNTGEDVSAQISLNCWWWWVGRAQVNELVTVNPCFDQEVRTGLMTDDGRRFTTLFTFNWENCLFFSSVPGLFWYTDSLHSPPPWW